MLKIKIIWSKIYNIVIIDQKNKYIIKSDMGEITYEGENEIVKMTNVTTCY